MTNMYDLVQSITKGMRIGDSQDVPIPDNIGYFRKYLSEISKREGKKFATKVNADMLTIMRVKYSNIYSKELE